MKAILQHQFGAPDAVLRLGDVEKPVVGDDDVLVRVRASSANPWDWHYIRGEPLFMRPAGLGVRTPKFQIPGGDVAGTVEDVGSTVQAFKPGDDVFGFGHGAFAEYLCVRQGRLAAKPTNLTFEQAAAVPLAAVTALQGLREAGGIQSGQQVLIVGASGGVGTFAVQIAKALGATVTGVCSTRNMDLVRGIGADHVIDYTSEDFTRNTARYDLVLTLGGTTSPSAIRRVLAPTGTLVQSSGDGGRWFGPIGNILKGKVLNAFVGQTLKFLDADVDTASLDFIRELIEAGKVTPVIDRSYPLGEAGVAVRLVEAGSPQGKVVVTVSGT
jgi:NADPH:quinone reductase-like Zn-dependent oxidoreductase